MADDTRSRILNAAGEVFAQKGYKSATVRDICDTAGVKNFASVNYYFGDKERLYVEAVRLAHPGKSIVENLPEWPPDTPPAAKLRVFIRMFVSRLMDTRAEVWQLKLMHREIMDPTPSCRELLQGYFRANFTALRNILDEMLPADVPEYKRNRIGFSIIGQCVYFRAATAVIPMVVDEEEFREHYGADELAEHIADLCLAALGQAPPLSSPAETATDSPQQPHEAQP